MLHPLPINPPSTPTLPPDAEWATEGYSFVVREASTFFVYVFTCGTMALWDVDWSHSEAMRKARKAGNRLRRMHNHAAVHK